MAFFLIGRSPDDDLRLLSTKPFESRQAAMAELALLSAEPTFDQWDAEVSVVDLDTGVPVLLVRPAATITESVGVTDAAQTGDADAWEADLPIIVTPAPELASVAAPVDLTPEPELEEAAQLADAFEAESWEPPAVALIEPVGDDAIADAIVAQVALAEAEVLEPEVDLEEAFVAPELVALDSELLPAELEPAIVPEPELVPWVEPVEEAAEAPVAVVEVATGSAVDENDELRAAIQRTTEHMAAEGIVPPESVEAGVVVAETPVAEAGEVPTPVEAPATEPGPDVEAAQPQGTPLMAAQTELPAAEESSTTFWPWDKSAATAESESDVAPEVAGVYSALEEPATELPEPDVEAVLSPSVASPQEGGVDASLEPGTGEPQEPMSSLSDEAPATAPATVPLDESDFILDLDSVESEPAEPTFADAPPMASEPVAVAVEDLGAEPDPIGVAGPATAAPVEPLPATPAPATDAVSPLEDYTCDDCVHTETCPNRDQRLPKDCGSFQWR